MDQKKLLTYGLKKAAAVEEYPFGPAVPVLKVGGKIFAILGVQNGQAVISLKCNPDYAELLRLQYACIRPGYHLNKRHWNTIQLDGSLHAGEVTKLLDQSYALVRQSLTKKQQTMLSE